MTSEASKRPNAFLFSVKGRLDGVTSPDIKNQIDTILSTGYQNLIIDCSALEYISSAGIRVLLQGYHQAEKNHGKIALTGVSNDTEQVLFVTGFLPYFKLFASNEDAFAFFNKEEA
nr:STAS domain-containing protein [Candidatus Clavichlamydia salmonicola]